MPNNDENVPEAAVGDKRDAVDYELLHVRTLSKTREQYAIRWSSGVYYATASSEQEFAELEGSKEFKKVKKAHKLTDERYQKNDNEPLRI